MIAYAYSQYGAPEVLRAVELPTPTPAPNEVLIKVVATTVSSGDWRARSMTMPLGLGFAGRLMFGFTGPRKQVLGTELSGVIEAVGADVTTFEIGDAVIAFPGAKFGAHAEFITMPVDKAIVKKPSNLSYETAAALSFGGTTAYDFLFNKAKIQAGERVLVNGASGSTGSACVQLAKHLGAEVTGVSSAANLEIVRSIGADHVIDYKVTDFTQEGAHYDVVIDTVGSVPWSRARHALVPNGRMVLIAGATSDMIFGAIKALLRGKRLIGGVASESVEILQKVADLAENGDFNPVIDRCYDFSQMIDAHRHVDTGHKKGNVVVKVAREDNAP